MPGTIQHDHGIASPADPRVFMRSAGNTLADVLPPQWRSLSDAKTALPKLAKDCVATAQIKELTAQLPTEHHLVLGNARELRLESGSVHLVITSPPYWTLKEYPEIDGQLGRIDDYEAFLRNLKTVWSNCYDALVPGGRLVCVVGDVCLSRRQNRGRHTVLPLHAAIQEQCRRIGFDNLAPIIWHKIANMQTEAKGTGVYLGKPFEPNGVIKNDIEFILMLRKPGGYRRPSMAARVLSLISAEDHDAWFRQIWTGIGGASTKQHPAPFPAILAERLIRMFSFVGDTVLDPFTGTASTQVAAAKCGRHSVGIEIEPSYIPLARKRLSEQPHSTVYCE